MVEILKIKPEHIEQESFRIIEEEFEQHTGRSISTFSKDEFSILRRVIHATADFSLADSIYFTGQSVANGVKAILNGKAIYTDVSMVASGISKVLTEKFNNRVFTLVHEPGVIQIAKEKGLTRSEAAIDRLKGYDVGIVVVGNAPTALIRTIQAVKEGVFKPELIIGVPVGFVNAVESKELLVESQLSAITIQGRRGGSPIAAAIVNALLKIAQQNATN